jgi:hypothetical protein
MKLESKTEESLFEKCGCTCHLFEIQRYIDKWGEYEEKGFNLSYWNMGRDNILCWKDRLKWIWRIFQTGNPFSDGVMINDKQAKEIADYINKHLPKE